MSTENLIPFTERTEDELREITKRGGKNSGGSRRRKKSLKQMLNLILASEPVCIPEELRFAAERMDIDCNDMLYAVSLFIRALADTPTAKYMDELLGRNPILELKYDELSLKRDELSLKREALQKGARPAEVFDDRMFDRFSDTELKLLAGGGIVEIDGHTYRLLEMQGTGKNDTP